ncbi:MAG: NEW3 domain-containing protein [Gemmatimonadales bacterium]
MPEPAAGQGVSLASADRIAMITRGDEVRTASAVTVVSKPPSFETVEIPRPDGFRIGQALEYQVISTGEMPILGVLRGTIPPAGSGSVLLTLSVPPRARAGIIEVARVRFTAPGIVPVEVPVQVEVSPAAAIDLHLLDGTSMVVRGERLQLRYTVANVGNRAEEVTVAAILPPAWRTSGEQHSAMTLGVNEMREQLLVLEVPASASTGSAIVRLVATIAGQPVATAEARVTVLDARRTTGSGPRLTTGLVAAAGPSDGATYAYTAAIDGQLTPGIRIRGRFQGSPERSSGGNLLFHRLGASRLPSSLELSASSWRVAVGHAGARFSDLTGNQVMGTGATSTIRSARWTATAVAARPGSGRVGDQREGLLAGGRLEFNTGSVRLGATGSHLVERGYEERRLDAVGLDAMAPSLWGGELSAELAHRRYATGAGLGYSARFVRRTPTDNLSVQVTHAPGGRLAYAQAADQVSVSAGRALTSFLGIHGGYWHSRDGRTSSFSSLASGGWNGSANLRISQGFSMGLGGRRSSFDATGAAGRFSTIEEAVEANLNIHTGAVYARGRSTIGTTRRETAISPDTPGTVEAGRRLTLDGTLGARSSVGHFSVGGRYERSDAASGSIPVRAEVNLRAGGVPIIRRGAVQIRAMAELRQSYWPGFGPARTGVVTGLTADLPLGFAIELAAERNPFFVGANGTAGWLYGVRIERSTRLPALAREETRGVVYHDVNGNGQRDPGEPGVAGAVVNRGGAIAVSGEHGTYSLPGTTGGYGALDPFSLGHGWITGSVGVVDGRQEIAVIPVAPVEVLLTIDDPQGRGIAIDVLTPAAVLARDESGRVWVARREGAARAFFDALPAGQYTIEVDLLEVREPLRAVEAMPAFTVRAGARSTPITVRLSPRQMQVRQLEPTPTHDPGDPSR